MVEKIQRVDRLLVHTLRTYPRVHKDRKTLAISVEHVTE